MRRFLFATILIFIFSQPIFVRANDNLVNLYEKRMELYKNVEATTHIPWYYIAAIDQYERNIRQVRRDLPKADGVIGIYIPPEKWAGLLNPDPSDDNPFSITLFQGIGIDGNGDGKAKNDDDEDVLFTIANHMLNYGIDHDNIKIALWEYYQRDKTVSLIVGYARMYRHFGRINLDENTFPLPLHHNFTYRTTWGHARGWGGRRIHEGTDIFAGYGVPVRSTSYGIVEMKGWNKYGGWRIGIRDMNNTYHYYAHLGGFAKDIHKGQIVEPGTVIGAVGSSGYGPPGTSGKFPPHLHYGMYKDNGSIEWSFDPFPHLKKWERLDRQKR